VLARARILEISDVLGFGYLPSRFFKLVAEGMLDTDV
jgi:hypothetical protein